MRLRRLIVAFVLLLVSAIAGAQVRNLTPVDDGTSCSGGQYCWTESVYTETWDPSTGTLVGNWTTVTKCLCL